MNGGRSAFFSGVATAVAIFVIVFGLAAALGELGSATNFQASVGKLIGEIAARLPVTFEPILISFFVATALGFVMTIPSAPAFRIAVAVIVTGLQSLPLFVLATFGVFLFLGMPKGYCLTPCSFDRELAYLVLPVAVLTIYQLPFLVKFFDRRNAFAQDDRDYKTSTISGLAVLFADRLPSLVSAGMIGEIIYGWAGEGRLLGIPAIMFSRDAPAFTIFLIFNALVVLAIRCLIDLFVRRRNIVTVAGD